MGISIIGNKKYVRLCILENPENRTSISAKTKTKKAIEKKIYLLKFLYFLLLNEISKNEHIKDTSGI